MSSRFAREDHLGHLSSGPSHTIIVGASTILIISALLLGTWAYLKSRE